MTDLPRHHSKSRVLLIGNAGAASGALKAWLAEQEDLAVGDPSGATVELLAYAVGFRPDVVLLDFHGLPVSTAHTIRLLKEISPAPVVLVLTHDSSPAMRRICREAGADAVFDKTAELEALAAALASLRRSARPASNEEPSR